VRAPEVCPQMICQEESEALACGFDCSIVSVIVSVKSHAGCKRVASNRGATRRKKLRIASFPTLVEIVGNLECRQR